MTSRVLRAAGLAVLIAAVAVVVVWRKVGFDWLKSATSATAASSEPVATDAELAVVAPLRAGSRLGDWDVARITSVLRDGFHIVLTRGDRRAVIQVALAAEGGGMPPPCVAPPYAVYYSSRDLRHDDALGVQLCQRVCAIVEKNRKVPPPPGLRPIAGTSAPPASSSAPSPAAVRPPTSAPQPPASAAP